MATNFKRFCDDLRETFEMKQEIHDDLKASRMTLKRVKRIVKTTKKSPLSEAIRGMLALDVDAAMDNYTYATDKDSWSYLLAPLWARVALLLSSAILLACFLVYQGIVLLDQPLVKMIEAANVPSFVWLTLIVLFILVITFAIEIALVKMAEGICRLIARSRVKALQNLRCQLVGSSVANS